MLDGFKKFILRGNVVDLAVGVAIGAVFADVVDSLVKDIITPIVGAIFKVPNFDSLVFTINGSEFMYGHFLNTLITFILTATAIYFFVVLPLNRLMKSMGINQEISGDKTK